MIINLKEELKIGCKFRIEKFNKLGTNYKSPKFNNTVLNNGLDNWNDTVPYISESNGLTSFCNVGTNGTLPSISQTGLLNYIASTSDRYGSTSWDLNAGPPSYISWSQTHEFPIGSFDNNNLSEVGLSKISNDDYFNRQLFLNEEGVLTSITVKSDEGLRVVSYAYIYAPMQPGESLSGEFDINETTYEFTKDFNSANFISSDIYSRISGCKFNACNIGLSEETNGFTNAITPSSITRDSYVLSSFEQNATAVWDAAVSPTTINSIYVGFNMYNSPSTQTWYFGYRLSNPITILTTESLTLNFKMTWGRL